MSKRLTSTTYNRLRYHAEKRGMSWSKFRKLHFPGSMKWEGPRLTEARGKALADALDADACPQCHGPVHESGFCPICKENVA